MFLYKFSTISLNICQNIHKIKNLVHSKICMSSLFLNRFLFFSLTKEISAFTLLLLNIKSLFFDFKIYIFFFFFLTAFMDESSLFSWKFEFHWAHYCLVSPRIYVNKLRLLWYHYCTGFHTIYCGFPNRACSYGINVHKRMPTMIYLSV